MTTESDSTESLGQIFKREWQRLGLMPADAPRAEPKPAPEPHIALRAQRMARFDEFCPQRFREKIDRTLIPNLAAWDDADKWAGAHPGVWLWSHDTGEAKTRMLWRKFGQLHVERGLTIARITGANLAEEYHDAFNKSRTAEFYGRITSFQIMMIDDIDKMSLPREGAGFGDQDNAQRNARMLREVFDRFYEKKTPLLVTANESIQWFGERIGQSGERRIRETCNEIPF